MFHFICSSLYLTQGFSSHLYTVYGMKLHAHPAKPTLSVGVSTFFEFLLQMLYWQNMLQVVSVSWIHLASSLILFIHAFSMMDTNFPFT